MNIGIQISSFRPLMRDAAGLGDVLAHMRAMGCLHTQLQWIDKSVPVPVIAELLRQCGIRAWGAQDKSPEVFADEAYYLELCAATGGGDLCLSGIPDGDAQAFAKRLEALREKAEGRIGLSFHPVKADLSGAAQSLLALCPWLRLTPDVCQLRDAGLDPASFIAAYPGRVQIVHFKDRAKDGSLCPVGSGETDFVKALKACREAGAELILAEQETWQNAYPELSKGYRYLQKLTLA